MKRKVKVTVMVFTEIAVFLSLLLYGYSYYTTSLKERFFHSGDELLRSSGLLGHGLGIIGSILIVTGVFSYMARKRIRRFSRVGLMKNWLVFHIFLCSLGSILILFHTTFKFGGLIAVGFWSLVLVVGSGIIGRYIYNQIPRTIEGRELSLQELHQLQKNIGEVLRAKYSIDEGLSAMVREYQKSFEDNNLIHWLRTYFNDLSFLRKLKREVRAQHLSRKDEQQVVRLLKEEISLNHRIRRLSAINRLFRYWHVIHLPFALVMLVIMIIHVVVVVLFGYKWIF